MAAKTRWPVRMHVSLSREQHEALKERAERENEAVATLMREAVDQFLGRPLRSVRPKR
jgi:hypothetical protein